MNKIPEGFTFSIIRHRGSPMEAETVDGAKVTRKDMLYLDSFKMLFKCAPYLDHFVYKDPNPNNIVGRWTLMCTCGSPAVVVNYDAYKQDASAQGALVVCLIHAQTGKHQDGTLG